MNLVDILIIIFIGLSCFEGYRKGFIKTLFDTVGLVIAFLISRKLYGVVEQILLKNTKLFVKVRMFFEGRTEGLSNILENSKEGMINSFTESLKLPVELQSVVSNIFTQSSSSNTDVFATFIDAASVILIRSISYLIVFLIIYIILVVLSNFINVLFKLPGLNITNRFFGGGVGFLKSVIILYIVFALFSPVIGFNSEGKISEKILESESSKIFYDNNLILNYLSYKGFFEN